MYYSPVRCTSRTRRDRVSFVTTKSRTTLRPAAKVIGAPINKPRGFTWNSRCWWRERSIEQHICKSDMNYESLSGQMFIRARVKTSSRVKKEKQISRCSSASRRSSWLELRCFTDHQVVETRASGFDNRKREFSKWFKDPLELMDGASGSYKAETLLATAPWVQVQAAKVWTSWRPGGTRANLKAPKPSSPDPRSKNIPTPDKSSPSVPLVFNRLTATLYHSVFGWVIVASQEKISKRLGRTDGEQIND